MAEDMIAYKDTIVGEDGTSYRAVAVGEERPNGLWDGWIRFDLAATAASATAAATASAVAPLRTPRETTQPNHADLLYWASGLSHTYLEGALARAVAHPPGGAEA